MNISRLGVVFLAIMIPCNTVAYVIDLDHTLVRIDTTFEFLKLLCPIKYAVLSKLLRPINFLNHILKRDVYKMLMTKLCISSFSRMELEYYSKICYKVFVTRYLNHALVAFLHKKSGVPKILLTASLDFIADNFKELGFNLVISSKTYFKNEIYHSLFDLHGRKSSLLQIISKYFDEVIVIDDSPEPEFYNLRDKVLVVKVNVNATV